MPFGKYKGKPVEELPSEYLDWLYFDCECRGRLRREVAAEWRLRFGDDANGHDRAPADIPGLDLDADERELVGQVLKAGFRVLSVKLHPDMGGSHEHMIRLNLLREKLRERFP